MNDETTAYGFLCGADMDPGKIRRNPMTSGARFAGIGSISAAAIAQLHLPLPDVDEIWGVVITLPEPAKDAPQADITMRMPDTMLRAAVLTDAGSFGTISDVVSEAHYWELPRAWRNALDDMARDRP